MHFEKSNLQNRSRFQFGLYDEDDERDACGIGVIANATKPAQHSVVEQGLEILKNLSHRSALGADGISSDGAGVLTQIPDQFFRHELKRVLGVDPLPQFGLYAVAQIFVSKGESSWIQTIKDELAAHGFGFVALREVPVNSSVLGPLARETEPQIFQLFLKSEKSESISVDVNRRLYELRSWAESTLRAQSSCRDFETGAALSQFYICSISTETIVYKGLMQPKNLSAYYLDLQNPEFRSQFAMVHSRFSTNTLPAWELAQPFRFSCHNGEINTIRSNRQWMKARGFPLTSGRSDSNSLDETFEILLLNQRPLVQAMMMMIPEPWESNPHLAPEIREFYRYHALRMEPWDGPAALCLTDGKTLGLCLDRNGLRPCRYQILDDGTLVAGSEAGALGVPVEKVIRKGQLSPSCILTVDLMSGLIDTDNKTKFDIAKLHPYSEWNRTEEFVPEMPSISPPPSDSKELWSHLLRFGYQYDEVLNVLLPLFKDKEEPLSSMGVDTPLAILSDRPQLFTSYFRQLFAQVTNPPIDPLREKYVMSLTTFLGKRASVFDFESDRTKRWRLDGPILFSQEMSVLYGKNFACKVVDSTFDLLLRNLESGLEEICTSVALAVRNGAEIVVLSDRRSNQERAAMPSLLVVSAVHQHLIREGLRLSCSIIAETGEVSDSHQVACLISFGADGVYPYLMEQLSWELDLSLNYYRQAIHKGLLKIMSKLGISTLQSYCGAQSFEILGLSNELADKYFPGTANRIGGIDMEVLQEEIRRRWQHVESMSSRPTEMADLPSRGDLHYRADGEIHQWNPTTLSTLQQASRTNSYESYRSFSDEVERNSRFTIRGHLHLRKNTPSIPLDQVESAREIVKRFTTGAMSLGALSAEAHEVLAIAMNRIGAKSNSGEGGEDAKRFKPDPAGVDRNSAIKQIASGRFGVTAHYLVNAKELQIKMAQGAKPGEGGQLSGSKIDSEIARIRHSTPGVTLISPPPHHDIYSIEDLAQLIFDLQCVNPTARVSVKLVSKAGVGTIAAGVAKAKAHKILISGDGGGTGSSALSSIRHAGAPWELGLAETHQTLRLNGLRSKVKLEVDGQLRTGRDVAVAALLGADEFGFSTAPLVVEGCLMMRKCHLNTCPVGVATQDPELRKKFSGQAEHVINYFFFVAEELREIMAQLGVRKLDELVGRVDLLEWLAPTDHWKAKTIDLSTLLISPIEMSVPEEADLPLPTFDQRNSLADLLEGAQRSEPLHVENTDRSVGAWLSGEIARRWGASGLQSGAVQFSVRGSTGQSLGAFLARGVRLEVVGEANDYVGKGLSGGRIVIRPESAFKGCANGSSLVGNTCLYGATSGEMFIAGRAGERFAVRNSGATVVVEGLGDHGCEYMTGGRVVVLGETGINFAAGMSGGFAYVHDQHGDFSSKCNLEMVDIEPLSDLDDERWLFETLKEHQRETESQKAGSILARWDHEKARFSKIVPREYRKVLLQKRPVESLPVLQGI